LQSQKEIRKEVQQLVTSTVPSKGHKKTVRHKDKTCETFFPL